jgi:hypothetical protein
MDELCDFPWIYDVSNGFTVISINLFGCLASLDRPLVTNSLSPQTASLSSIFSCALLEPSIPSRVEREQTLNTPLWEKHRLVFVLSLILCSDDNLI